MPIAPTTVFGSRNIPRWTKRRRLFEKGRQSALLNSLLGPSADLDFLGLSTCSVSKVRCFVVWGHGWSWYLRVSSMCRDVQETKLQYRDAFEQHSRVKMDAWGTQIRFTPGSRRNASGSLGSSTSFQSGMREMRSFHLPNHPDLDEERPGPEAITSKLSTSTRSTRPDQLIGN